MPLLHHHGLLSLKLSAHSVKSYFGILSEEYKKKKAVKTKVSEWAIAVNRTEHAVSERNRDFGLGKQLNDINSA